MTAQKKVILRRFLGDSLAGYLPGGNFVSESTVSFLDLAGRVTLLPIGEVKFVAYVRNFSLGDAAEIDRTLRRTFAARPRMEGLWVRVTFRTGDSLEGMAPPGLALLDDVLGVRGLQLTPPDTRANAQRIYVPRDAMQQLELLGVVSAATRQRAPKPLSKTEAQHELFQSPELAEPLS